MKNCVFLEGRALPSSSEKSFDHVQDPGNMCVSCVRLDFTREH